MLWSMTHSPTPRYLSIHFVTSWLSPTFSALKLGLYGFPAGTSRVSPLLSLGVVDEGDAHVRPVERFMPARKAETALVVSRGTMEKGGRRRGLHSTASNA